jgi:Holliday junction resolvase RusA-like endonuclease
MQIKVFIPGEPYCQNKTKGNVSAGKAWTQTIIKVTENLPKINTKCKAEIVFTLPENKYPSDHPYGSDLDNLLKRLFDALNQTIFTDVPGKDGSVVEVKASKKKTSEIEPPGAHIDIQEI